MGIYPGSTTYTNQSLRGRAYRKRTKLCRCNGSSLGVLPLSKSLKKFCDARISCRQIPSAPASVIFPACSRAEAAGFAGKSWRGRITANWRFFAHDRAGFVLIVSSFPRSRAWLPTFPHHFGHDATGSAEVHLQNERTCQLSGISFPAKGPTHA
jgi:hypothetical protein